MNMKRNEILIVDDDKDNRVLLKEILSNFFPGKKILCLANGGETWDEVQKDFNAVWLIITDWEMPRMNGLELTKAIKAAFPEIPVILTSANDTPAKNPADAFLAKPFLIRDLLALIQKITTT